MLSIPNWSPLATTVLVWLLSHVVTSVPMEYRGKMPCTGQPATHVHVAQSMFLVSAGNLICLPLGISQKSISKSPELLCITVLSSDQSMCRM